MSLLGFRSWRLRWAGPREIVSVHFSGTVWRPGQDVRASCGKGFHPPPVRLCTCGLYANRDQADIDRPAFSHGELYGAVAAWGRVVVHTGGFRSEYARPVAFFDSPRLNASTVDSLAERFGIPVLARQDAREALKGYDDPAVWARADATAAGPPRGPVLWTVTAAREAVVSFPADLPPYCRVEMTQDHATNTVTYTVFSP